mgnify:CR=1 FL=1
MKLEIKGDEVLPADQETVWLRLNDPEFLTLCVPGCKAMELTGEDAYRVEIQLSVASVSGGFDGHIALSDKQPPEACSITVKGEGSLGHGTGTARFTLTAGEDGTTRIDYLGEGEIGGLVAGVGQRVLRGVSKHLIKKFFKTAKTHLAEVKV